MIAGSNSRVAWGFTNAYGDWTDLVILETDPADLSARVARYARGNKRFIYLRRRVERICLRCDHTFTMDKPTISAMLDRYGHLMPEWQRDVLYEWCSRQ